MEYAGLYLCYVLLVLLVGRRELWLWVLWCTTLVVVVKTVTVSGNDGLGAVYAVKLCFEVFSYFSIGCFRIVLLMVSQHFINII